jgi:ribosome recycling factor
MDKSIRLPIPPLSEERRKDLVKLAHKYAENTKVSVRNVRRDGMDQAKKMEKDGVISEDEEKKLADEIQKLTDNFIGKIEENIKTKEQEILNI